MNKWLIKGLLRDRHRSLFPVIIVAAGVLFTTTIYSWMMGVFNDVIDGFARFSNGHVKVMTRGYMELSSQIPNDLCLVHTDKLIPQLEKEFPGYSFVSRIKFGGLIDIPDENGETKDQAPVAGLALELLKNNDEIKRLNLDEALVAGALPGRPGEILISQVLAEKLGLKQGDAATLLGSSASGGMSISNFIISGTLRFGVSMLDRGTVIANLSDMQQAMDMNNACGEILGFSSTGLYNDKETEKMRDLFNEKYSRPEDQFSPVMLNLEDQDGMREYLVFATSAGGLIVIIFIIAMSIVLWNTSLMSGIRRYSEIGIRMAIGESKHHIYYSMLVESVFVGILGSIIGTAIGIALCYYLQEVGIDVAGIFKNASIMIKDVIRARITFTSYVIGFIPGLAATVIGSAIAGLAIFRRQTSNLIREME